MCPDGALWAVGCADAYENFSKKEKCDERDENLSYSERDCMEILLYCGDCIGEDHKYFLRGHSVLVYLTLNIYEP